MIACGSHIVDSIDQPQRPTLVLGSWRSGTSPSLHPKILLREPPLVQWNNSAERISRSQKRPDKLIHWRVSDPNPWHELGLIPLQDHRRVWDLQPSVMQKILLREPPLVLWDNPAERITRSQKKPNKLIRRRVSDPNSWHELGLIPLQDHGRV